jgi:deazaflavin-dependent oxidoreductase (nitroreductase family)
VVLDEEQFCHVRTTGRRTGQVHEIEIWFTAIGDSWYLISGGGDRSDWVKNLQAEPAATVRVGDEQSAVRARAPMAHDAERAAAVTRLHAKYAGQVSGSEDDWQRGSFIVALDRQP